MNTTIVYAHPWTGSFNRAILDAVQEVFLDQKRGATLIDLYKDGFNPVMFADELALYAEGNYGDPKIGEYINVLSQTDEMVFIFPIWWYGGPAMLHGFFDKVMLIHSAYAEGMVPIWDVGRTTVITTSEASTAALREEFGNPIEKSFIGGTLRSVGMTPATWLNFGEIGLSDEQHRNDFLQQVRQHFQK